MNNTRPGGVAFVGLNAVLAAIIFAVDLSLPLGVAGGVPYVVIVLVSLWSPRRRDTYLAAGAGTTLTVLGYFLSAAAGVHWMVLANRFLALFAIWVTAGLILWRKQTDAALRDAHDFLETRVADRTAELAEANDRLRESDERSRQQAEEWQWTFDAVGEAVLVVDGQGKILRANKALSCLCPEVEEPLVGRHCYEVLHGQEEPLEGCPHCETKCRGVQAEGELFESHRGQWIQMSSYPLSTSAEEPYPSVLVIRDITERKRAEEALQEAHEELENRVAQRTAELTEANRRLEEEAAERAQAEEALQESETKYRSLVESANAVLCKLDLTTERFTYIGRQVEQLLGYPADSWVDMGTWSDRIHPEDRDQATQYCQAAISRGEDHDFEYRAVAADGRIVWIRNVVSVIMGDQGPGEIICFMFDITERKRAEDALRKAHEELEHRVEQRTAELRAAIGQLRDEIREREEAERELRASEQRYRAVVEDQTELICRWKPDGCLLFVNDAYCRYYDRSREELIGHSFMPLIPEEDHAMVQEHFASLSSAKPVNTHQHRALAPDGQVRWQQWTNRAIFDGNGRVSEYQSVGRDITETRHAEQTLLESEERFRRAVVDAPVPMMIHAEDGEVLRINRVWTDLTGYHPEEIPTIADWTERAYGERREVARERIDKLYQIDGRVAEGEYTITTKDGRTIVWDFSSSPLGRLEDGRRLVLSIATDITERKLTVEQIRKHQEELAHMQRLSTMGEMATGLAHELNQPLASIVNYTQGCVRKLRAGTADTNELISILGEASDQAKRAGDIIRRVRYFVSKKTLERVEVKVAELVEQVTGLLRNELQSRGVSIEIHIGDCVGEIQADRIQLQQVLVNLMTNSMEAMEQTDEALRIVTLRASREKDGFVEICVADNGCGLPRGSDDEIFEPFYSTKPEGTGMGLAISRTIVEAHGGRLRATDNVDGGCTFCFSLAQHTEA